jgi:hypothetical protein
MTSFRGSFRVEIRIRKADEEKRAGGANFCNIISSNLIQQELNYRRFTKHFQ